MLRFFALCLLLTLLLANCDKDTSTLTCPENGDFGVDVIGGPSFGSFTPSLWAYLSDEAGNIRDEQGSSTYPIFLNWLDHCEENYTINIAQQGSYRPLNGGTSYFEIVNSFFGLKSGQAFRGGIRPSRFEDVIGGVNAQVITLDGFPSVDSTIVLGEQAITVTYLAGIEQLQVEIPNMNLRPSTSNVMIGVRLSGESFFRAIIMDLASEGNYTFEDFTERIVSHKVNFEGYKLNSLEVSVLLSEEEKMKMELGKYYTSNDQFNIWLPAIDKPYLISYEGKYEEEGYWSISEIVENIPTVLREKPNHVLSAVKENEFLNFNITEHCYLVASPIRYNITSIIDDWILEGPLSTGIRDIRIPPLGPEFDNAFPSQNLEELWENESTYLRLTFYHYPSLNTAEEYWQLAEKPWRDQLQYHTTWLSID